MATPEEKAAKKAEAEAAKAKKAADEAAKNAAHTETKKESDPLAFLTHPRRRELAQLILDGASREQFVEASFTGNVQIEEMRQTLKQRGLLK